MMDITVNEASPDLSCAISVGEKRPRNDFENLIVGSNNRRGSSDNGDAERSDEPLQPESTNPKFNDFDKMRKETNFEVGQTWALYDPRDKMPRLYAKITKVSSSPSFGLQNIYLEPDPDEDKEIQWCNEDLPVSVGQFRLGKNQNTKDKSMFSYLIHCDEGPKKRFKSNHFTITPRKGETWAIFKDWEINWSSKPDSHRVYEYEFVEILSDHSEDEYEDKGVFISYLDKAKGFASVFFRVGKGYEGIYRVSSYKLYRFSHRVPSFKLTGTEANGLPKDAYELDQSALPETIEEVDILPLDSDSHKDTKRQSIYFASHGKLFQTRQIWSFFSGYDDLPLYYCKIQKVTFTQTYEQKPVFKVQIKRLKAIAFPKGVTDWDDGRMPVGCGTFYARNVLETITDSQLSQQITPQVSMHGVEYTILPKIGNVWAIYKYSCKCIDRCDCTDMEDLEREYYVMVEVLDDALDGYKVQVLKHESYFKDDTYHFEFFKKAKEYENEDEESVKPIFTIPKKKRLRFSNKVPASRVTKELHGKLKEYFKIGYRELPFNVKHHE